MLNVKLQAFLPHLKRSLPFAVQALQEESEVVHKQAVAAVRQLIDDYGATAPHLLLPRMQEATLNYNTFLIEIQLEIFYFNLYFYSNLDLILYF